MSRYRIPKQRVRVEVRVSNSRFIATLAPASTMKAAQDFLREIRAEMPDATHHVYAFKIGYGASVSEGMSDDGEPSGTSGPPALAVLRGADIGDVALVITRYFGGTKLGTGGLVAAYTHAAQAALTKTETEEKVTRLRFEASIPYPLYQSARRLLDECDARVEHEDFAADVRVRYLVPDDCAAELADRLTTLSSGHIIPKKME